MGCCCDAWTVTCRDEQGRLVSTGGAAAGAVDRAAILADLLACRDDLHHLLATATPTTLRARTNGTMWSNEQLLFHMVFGFLVVRRLLPLVRLMSRLPARVGRAFARALDSGRSPFHWVNYAGCRCWCPFPRCSWRSSATAAPKRSRFWAPTAVS